MRYRILNNREAIDLLTQPHEYYDCVSQSTLQLLGAQSGNDLRNMMGGLVRNFKENERIIIEAHLNRLQERLVELGLDFDVEILVAKTTGRESNGMAYTRDNILVFPETLFGPMGEAMAAATGVGLNMGLMAHEFFHVISRQQPLEARNQELYPIWGFYRHDFERYPQNILTNPDVPNHGYAVMVEHNGQNVLVAPVLKAPATMQDVPNLDKMLWDGNNFIHRDETNYMQVTGSPSNYSAYHPEEISAEAFRLWMQGNDFERLAAFEAIVRSWL